MLLSKMSSKQILPLAVTTTVASMVLLLLYLIDANQDMRIVLLLTFFAVASWIRYFLSKRKENAQNSNL